MNWPRVCAHGMPLTIRYQHCINDKDRRQSESESAAARLDDALAEVREWWREVGGDYYPATERIAAKHDVDVWVLREVWLAPVYKARREAVATREA